MITDYKDISLYDKVFISKVFTDTPIEDNVLELPNVEYGGTGFYYDKAIKLPYEIEHCMPDYHLYDKWVEMKLKEITKDGRPRYKRNDFKYYLDYSIGFMTRGCFRQCSFCVNKNYKKANLHSPLEEFLDKSRKKICLLDDNVLGCSEWKAILKTLQNTGKPFQFKQGLDERILTDEKVRILSQCKYDGEYIFAFDNIEDRSVIEKNIGLFKKYIDKIPKFYVFVGMTGMINGMKHFGNKTYKMYLNE